MTKKAEERVRNLANYYGWFKHKYGDVRYCVHCHKPLPKTENAPDFYISQIGDWIEAKNNDASGTWKCSELFPDGERKNQRQFLKENSGWIFLELADGNAPKSAGAWLIPFVEWESNIEPWLISNDYKSIRRETARLKCGKIKRWGAEDLFKDYALTWKQNVGWVIPINHIYMIGLEFRLKHMLANIAEERSNEWEQQPLI